MSIDDIKARWQERGRVAEHYIVLPSWEDIGELLRELERLEWALEEISTCGSMGVAEVTARQALKKEA